MAGQASYFPALRRRKVAIRVSDPMWKASGGKALRLKFLPAERARRRKASSLSIAPPAVYSPQNANRTEDHSVTDIIYRSPSLEDGAAIWEMVDEAAALDANSAYAYFMVCRNFAATSVVAEVDGDIAGMVTAYPLPEDNRRLFVWQVNVREPFQGLGIASGMLEELMTREDCSQVRYIETTIAPDNEASEALFRRIAHHYNAQIRETEVYKDELFAGAEHQVERLFVIGPITRVGNRIEIRREDDGYRLYAVFEGGEQPAFEPRNPAFSSWEDAMKAAEEVREAHAAREVVLAETNDLAAGS
jgi:L-2,4-diaminobutyric acid acetyltransferase